MALLRIAIMQAGGVFANQTVITPAAAVMRFNTDPVPHGEFIDCLAQGHHSSRPLMPRRKGPKGQGKRKMPIVDLEITTAGPTHRHFYQHFARTGPPDGTIDHADVPRAEEYSRTHRLRNGILLYARREGQRHAVLRMLRAHVPSRWEREHGSMSTSTKVA